MSFRIVFAAVLVLVCVESMAVQEDALSRQGFFGARMTEPPAEAGGAGVYLDFVMEGSSAESAGLQQGDILTRIGGAEVSGREGVFEAARLFKSGRAGDTLPLEYLREGEAISGAVQLAALPVERFDRAETLLDSVVAGDARLRVIVTRPEGKSGVPAVLYLQGLSCGSVESPLNPEDVVHKLLQGWNDAGYATFRVEKSGVGDSRGAPCESIGFHEELAGYLAATRYALEQDFVDADRVFLFGHSMGGVFAPLVAVEEAVGGVMVYGTIAKPLPEYFLENGQRQLRLREVSQAVLDRNADTMTDFLSLFLGARLSPGEILARDAKFRSYLSVRNAGDDLYHGRHYTFWHELDDVDVESVWTAVTAPVMAVWGESDIAASRNDHTFLVAAVNRYGEANGTYLQLPNIDHGFDAEATMEDSQQRRSTGRFNDGIVRATVEWMDGLSNPDEVEE